MIMMMVAVMLNGRQIEVINQFLYLGCVISTDHNIKEEKKNWNGQSCIHRKEICAN